MKKFLFSLMALLFLTRVSFAANIPESILPQTGGPEVWLMSVFNNSGASMDAGDVAISDVDASTGTNDNWVTTTTTVDTYLVMGVVYPVAIADQDSGTIAIRGPVSVDIVGSSFSAANQLICSSGTAGSATNCITAAANFGWSVAAGSSGSVVACVNCGF